MEDCFFRPLALSSDLSSSQRNRRSDVALFCSSAIIRWAACKLWSNSRSTDSPGLHQQPTLHPPWIHSTLHPHRLPGKHVMQLLAMAKKIHLRCLFTPERSPYAVCLALKHGLASTNSCMDAVKASSMCQPKHPLLTSKQQLLQQFVFTLTQSHANFCFIIQSMNPPCIAAQPS